MFVGAPPAAPPAEGAPAAAPAPAAEGNIFYIFNTNITNPY
jgi:hypothetical protein